MSERIEKHSLLELTCAALIASLLLSLLLMTENSDGRTHHANYSEASKRIADEVPPGDNEFGSKKQLNQSRCYQGESIGECAARIVQERVSNFYVFLILAAFMQAIVAFLTWTLLRKQNNLMSGQLEAAKIAANAAQTAADAALASLAKPWLIMENITHNEDIWRSGNDRLKSHFHIANYGNAPGFVMFIHCGLFLSPGPELYDKFPIKPVPKTIRKFPEAHELRILINEITQPIYKEFFVTSRGQGAEAEYERITIDEPVPVPSNERTSSFSILGPEPPESPTDTLPPERLAKVFFVGRIGYTGPDDDVVVINFLYTTDTDGSFSVVRGAPYNEKTRYKKSQISEARLGL